MSNTTTEKTHLIFAYGTLLEELLSIDEITSTSKFYDIGYIHGEIYDLDHFSAINEGTNKVVGELYELTDQALEQLDKIVKYDPNTPSKSPFNRKKIEFHSTISNDSEMVESYFYHCALKDKATLISNGDYFDYLRKRELYQFGIPYTKTTTKHNTININSSKVITNKPYTEQQLKTAYLIKRRIKDKYKSTKKTFLIFVYGTSLKGLKREQELSQSQLVDIGHICAKLYDIGKSSALNEGNNQVFGELYEVTEQTLEHLDKTDRALPDKFTKSRFLRKSITFHSVITDEVINAETYFYYRQLENTGTLISTTNYRDYLRKKSLYEYNNQDCEESLTEEENRTIQVRQDAWFEVLEKTQGSKVVSLAEAIAKINSQPKPSTSYSENDIRQSFLYPRMRKKSTFFQKVKQDEKRMIELASGNINESEFTKHDKLLLQLHKLEMEEELQEGFIDDYYED